MKGFLTVARWMRDDSEWRLLGGCVGALIIVCGAILVTAGPVAALALLVGVAAGSLVTALINEGAKQG